MTVRGVGALLILVGIAAATGGLVLARRYREAIQHTGFTSPFPRHHAWLAFLGQFGVIVGLIGVMIGVMFAFF